ncbi:RICIN domain-containing protein [Natronoglomus mannanivorans]|uniref:RICIN domain-containing protein n=1 Tax=Natronoglomus mannanivorans TaxID=2979990 RepID=A0AAP2Z106_9EURY|nr:RICIN domain-containing protein [Halobacteria archaeon AArc-xg1-1]
MQDPSEPSAETVSDEFSLTRRTALALLGVGGVASVAGTASASATGEEGERKNDGSPARRWNQDVDAQGHDLSNLGSLEVDHLYTSARDANVIVWRDEEGVYHADSHEETVHSSEDYFETIQAAVDSLSEGRTSKEKVLVAASGTVGPVDELTQIVLPSYTVLDVAGTIYVEDEGESLVTPIRAFGEERIEIPRLTIEGNPRFGIWIQNSDSVTLGNIDIRFENLDALEPYEDAPGDWPPVAFDPESSKEEILANRGYVGANNEGIRIDGRARAEPCSDIRISSVYVEGAGHHCVELYDAERVQIEQVIGVDMESSAVILNETENATVNGVVGENPESPSWYATFRCANGCENVSVGQVVSRDAPRGVHITTDSNDITIGEVNIVGARYHGIKIDDVENVTVQGGLVKNVVEEAVLSWADGLSISNLRIVDDLSEDEREEIFLPIGGPDVREQTHAIRFTGQNGRIVDNDVRGGGTEELISVDATNTIVRENLGDGIDSGTVTLESGADEAARVEGIHGRFDAAFDLRAEPAAVPAGPVAWTHYFEWSGEGWDLVFAWETDPGEDLELSYIVDQTQGGDVEIDPEPLEAGTYRISARHSGLSLSAADGANVQQEEWEDGENQRWHVTEDGDHFRLELAETGQVLEAEDGSTESGSNVRVGEDLGETHQRWDAVSVFSATGEYYYALQPAHTDVAIDIEAISQEPGANALLWEYGEGENQQFAFDEL